MATESATYIDGLDSAKPTSGETPGEGDDHLRLIKSTIKATFPNITGAVTPTHTELNYVDGVTSAIQTQLDAKSPIASPTFTGTVTIPNYTETLYAPSAGTAFTVDLANGTVQKLTSNGNLTITLPASASGKSYVIIVAYGGSHSLTWAGGSTIKWSGGGAPTATSTSGKFDIFSFFCDGTNTYAQAIGLNY